MPTSTVWPQHVKVDKGGAILLKVLGSLACVEHRSSSLRLAAMALGHWPVSRGLILFVIGRLME